MAALNPAPALARRVREERSARGWSLDDLARRAGVSRAMISKIERQEASPTAAVLGRLSGAFGLSISSLLAESGGDARRLLRRADQPVWVDPATGYIRRSVSPSLGAPLELIEVRLPPCGRIPFPASAYRFLHQQIWMISGRLRFYEGDSVHDLRAGDCLQIGPPQDCAYENVSAKPCRYLVALIAR
jgi:transcriptional regulator with XRE-family HTH domain